MFFSFEISITSNSSGPSASLAEWGSNPPPRTKTFSFFKAYPTDVAPRGARMKGVGTGTFSFRYPQAYCPRPGFDGELSRTEDSFTVQFFFNETNLKN